MTRSLSFSSTRLTSRILTSTFGLMAVAVFLFGHPPAQAQAVGGCVGSCSTPPSFMASVWGGGTTGAINVANFGQGGTGNSGSSVQDILNINVSLTAAGNPSGFCGEGCLGNNVTMNLFGSVMAQGFALHEFLGQNGAAGGTTANTASNVRFDGAAGGTWQYVGGNVIPLAIAPK